MQAEKHTTGLQQGTEKDASVQLPHLAVKKQPKKAAKKALKPKEPGDAEEASTTDPRVQAGENIVLALALSSNVPGKLTIANLLKSLRVTEEELADPLSLVVHTEMVKIVPLIGRPKTVNDYEVVLTDKGSKYAAFIFSTVRDRIEAKERREEREKEKLAEESSGKKLFLGKRKCSKKAAVDIEDEDYSDSDEMMH